MSQMSFDIYTLSIVVSGLSILGAITMYSQQHILFDHPALDRWVLGGITGSLAFGALLFYAQWGEWSVFLHTVGFLLSFFYLYRGVQLIVEQSAARHTFTSDGVFITFFIILSWLVRDDTSMRYLFHDLTVTFLGLLTLRELWHLSHGGRLSEFSIALSAYAVVSLAFLGRVFITVSGSFETNVNHPYNYALFLVVVFWVCGWVFGFSLILHKQRQRSDEEKLMRDELTGLLNRSGIMKVAGDWIVDGTPFYLYVLDLNGFKKVNDTFGHLQGDEALRAYTKLARSHLPSEARFARIGGDEFVIISSHPLDMGKTKLKYQLSIDDVHITLDASVGLAMFPKDGDSLETLFLVADEAMYVQKYAD